MFATTTTERAHEEDRAVNGDHHVQIESTIDDDPRLEAIIVSVTSIAIVLIISIFNLVEVFGVIVSLSVSIFVVYGIYATCYAYFFGHSFALNVGRLVNLIVVMMSFLFFGLVVYDIYGVMKKQDEVPSTISPRRSRRSTEAPIQIKPTTIFSHSFLQQGFCVKEDIDSPLASSHAFCFYADIFLSLLLWLKINFFPFAQSNKDYIHKPVSNIIAVTCIHGVGHFALAFIHIGSTTSFSWYITAVLLLFLCTFWTIMLYATYPPFESHRIMLLAAAILVTFGQALLPPALHFTYVMTVILTVGASSQLAMSIETVESTYEGFSASFMWFAIFAYLPTTILAWFEAFCFPWYQRLYGHIWYDISIPLGLFAYYCVASRIASSPISPAAAARVLTHNLSAAPS